MAPKASEKVSVASGPKPRRAAKKKTQVQSASLKTLQKTRDSRVKEYSAVNNTDKAYGGHVERGKKFLATVVAERMQRGEDVCAEGIVTEELAKAFDKPPNRYSAMAVEMFMVQKCFTEGLGKSTAVGIHGGFAAYWDNMDGNTYDGPYMFEEKTGTIRGCPARAPAVLAVLNAVKTRSKKKGYSATRNHAEAMSIEELQKLMRWSEETCPDELLTMPLKDVETLKFRLEHALMRAFVSSAFTLWTRCFELLTLEVGDIEEGCHGPAPYYIPHFKVNLENRKGWQHARDYDGPRTSCTYEIYKQDIPEIDMSTHLMKWRAFLQKLQPNRAPEDNDFIFPYVAPNGIVHPKRDMSYDLLQALLTKFTAAAGLKKHYTTHCFRRGGAQYRFASAPVGRRWPLSWIRWWGGWAIGENVDTLMKYLMDSLQSYENGHGNALHPIPLGLDQSFMGNHIAGEPASTEEIRQMKYSVDRKIDDLERTIKLTLVKACIHPSSKSAGVEFELPNQQSDPGASVAAQQIDCHAGMRPECISRTWQASRASSAPYFIPSDNIVGRDTHSRPGTTPPPEHGVCSNPTAKTVPPINVSIPDLGRSRGAWRRAIKQWEEVDPITKLALKDWPEEWYTGEMREVTGSKRGQRERVFKEFVRLGRSVDRFLSEYPDAERGFTQLLKAIRVKIQARRRSKYGTPQERGSREVSQEADEGSEG